VSMPHSIRRSTNWSDAVWLRAMLTPCGSLEAHLFTALPLPSSGQQRSVRARTFDPRCHCANNSAGSGHCLRARRGNQGDALILRLELTLEIADGEREVLRASSAGFFVESDVHPPKVEQQIAELASGDFVALARQLTARGHDIDTYELSEMYVHVELDEEVRRKLTSNDVSSQADPRGVRQGPPAVRE
jgi:hypothetical protein